MNKEFGDFVSDDIQPVSGSIEPVSSSSAVRREGTVGSFGYRENRASMLRVPKKERTQQNIDDFNKFY